MGVRKFAISVPEEIMTRVDQAAAASGKTRSAFISQVLKEIACAQKDIDIARKVERFFSDLDNLKEQKEQAEAFGRIANCRGTEW